MAVPKDRKLTMLSGTYNFTIYKKVKPRNGDCEGKEDKESRRSKCVLFQSNINGKCMVADTH